MPKDIHDTERSYKTGLETFQKDSRISAHNKEIFAKFLEDCKIGYFGEAVGTARLNKYLYHYKQVCIWLGKDIQKENSLEDIKGLAKNIDQADFSVNTKRDYRIFMKKFWKWLNGEEWVIKNLKWLKTTTKHSQETLPEDLPSEEEVMAMIEAAKSTRDKFFLSFLYESAARISEAGNLRFKDLHIHDGDSEVKLKGKTGERIVPIFGCAPLARQYLATAPFKNNLEAAVFNNGQTTEPMSYTMLCKIIRKAMVRAGITKHGNPHIFRHARLTWLAGNGNFNEAMLCAFAGWRIGSPMARTYVHLSKKNLQDALRRVSVKDSKPLEPIKSALSAIQCRICGLENSAGSGFCEKCGNALTSEALQAERSKREKVNAEQQRKFFDDIINQRFETLEKKMEELLKAKSAG